jgi:energy-coupling factor transporter ATP-binding protein EcfA2
MPFVKDTKNWNHSWEDDINIEGNGFTHVNEVQFDNEIEIVKFDIPEKKEDPKPEKQQAFYTNGKIPIIRNPYEKKEYIYTKKEFEFQPGVTVLVGCNGSGKTTLLHQIKEYLKKKKVPVVMFDNLHDGGSNARTKAAFDGDFTTLSTSLTSSEGEGILINLSIMAKNLRPFIHTGESQDRGDRLTRAFAKAVWGDNSVSEIPNERWILFDAIDSGLSIDNVLDVKEYLFKTILEDAGDEIKTFIIVSANAFEFANNENCLDTHTGKYVNFRTYEAYKKFVLKSREIKDKRYNKD